MRIFFWGCLGGGLLVSIPLLLVFVLRPPPDLLVRLRGDDGRRGRAKCRI